MNRFLWIGVIVAVLGMVPWSSAISDDAKPEKVASEDTKAEKAVAEETAPDEDSAHYAPPKVPRMAGRHMGIDGGGSNRHDDLQVDEESQFPDANLRNCHCGRPGN